MTLQGIRGFLRFELAEILPRKNAVFKKMKGILKLTDYCFNIIINKRLRIKTGNSQEGIFTERINAPDDEWDFFMQPFLPDSLFRRTRPDLAWISGYPWVLPLEKGDKQLDRYYFTAYEKRFEFRFYKLKNAGNEIIACIMISIRNNHLKVPYAFFEDEYVADVTKVLYAIMRKEGIATFTTFNPSITKYLKNNRSHFIFKKGLTREYLASSKVAANLPNGYEIQDGDGDCAFT